MRGAGGGGSGFSGGGWSSGLFESSGLSSFHGFEGNGSGTSAAASCARLILSAFIFLSVAIASAIVTFL